jgi:hypothetical protein
MVPRGSSLGVSWLLCSTQCVYKIDLDMSTPSMLVDYLFTLYQAWAGCYAAWLAVTVQALYKYVGRRIIHLLAHVGEAAGALFTCAYRDLHFP